MLKRFVFSRDKVHQDILWPLNSHRVAPGAERKPSKDGRTVAIDLEIPDSFDGDAHREAFGGLCLIFPGDGFKYGPRSQSA